MSVRNLDKLLAPRSVALIGTGSRPDAVGAVVARNLGRAGFRGELMLVDPDRPVGGGRHVYPDIAHLPHAPDLAVLAGPPETVPALIGTLGARGTRAAVVLRTGFTGHGERGRRLQQDMLDAAKPYLLRILGPNCLGLMVPPLGLDASVSHLPARPGRIAFLSQSAAIVTAILDWAAPRDIGFSHVLSLGDMADVDFGDTIDYLAVDPQTSAVLLYIERLTHGRKFMSAARAAARNKPVLVLRAGRSQSAARAGSSPTWAAADDDAVYEAVFRRAGMLRVDTLAELFAAAETLASSGEQSGDRLAILTNGGGAGVLAADALTLAGGRLAALSQSTIAALDAILKPRWSCGNLVDIGGDATRARYAAALAALFDDPEVDAIVVLNCPNALAEPLECARAVIEAARQPAAARQGLKLYTAWLGEHTARAARRLFAEARIATYESPDEAVAGFLHRVRHRRNRELLMETPPMRPDEFAPDAAAAGAVIARALAAGETQLAPVAVSAMLAAYGVPVVAGWPAGGDPAEAVANVQLFAGIVNDPVFGPLVAFGHGGTGVEIMRDTSLELPPLNALLARRLMARTRVWQLLQPDGDKPRADIDAVIGALIRLGQLAADRPEICELEINPLVATAAGAIALAARIRLGSGPTARLAIAPYPRHLAGEARLRDGTVVNLRPLRPEDEPLLADLFAHMSPEDLRLRFFTPIRRPTHAIAARLSQLDYDRELALLAERDGRALGAAHFFADPDNRGAEYAIAVSSDWQGRGIGYLLMTRLIEIARDRGIGKLVGEVLRENAPMLQMCRELGFRVAAQPEDPAVMLVTKPLAAD
jgi:acetyltransferase